ncbi:MAG: hypothetical protein Q8R78_07450, partial [Candidatus Omnitrophota bacterium]|nr:hypothetical protein [Candidatus Omnitrophota bacterium]
DRHGRQNSMGESAVSMKVPSVRLCDNDALVLQLGHFYFRPPRPIAKIETSPVCCAAIAQYGFLLCGGVE